LVPIVLVIATVTMFATEDNLARGIGELGLAVASAGMAYRYFTGREEPTPVVVPRLLEEAA